MKSVMLTIKGFFMGIANIIPGVSGGTIALIVGIYEDFIRAISHFFTNFKKNIMFLIPIFIGMGLSILLLSKVIDYSYNHFPVAVTLFFMGLVIGGVPLIKKNIDESKEQNKVINYILSLFTFALVIFFAFAPVIFSTDMEVSFANMNVTSYILLFFVGVIAAATMVIPGISGSLVLMLLGYYYPVIACIKDITKFEVNNIIILGVFGLGILTGIIFISKIIEYLFKNYKNSTYYAVLGFIIASIIAIPVSTIINVDNISINIIEVIIGLILLAVGTAISYYLGDKE